MTFKSGDCFYSKTLGKNVMYASGGRFISMAYRMELHFLDDLGELDPLVRSAHYEAAMDTAQRFVAAIDEAAQKHDSDYEEDIFGTGWHSAIGFIMRKVQPRKKQ